VGQITTELVWDAGAVSRLMSSCGIESRYALAKELGIPRNTVCSAFNARWEGRATSYLVAALCLHFDVRISDIVVEPILRTTRSNSGRIVHHQSRKPLVSPR